MAQAYLFVITLCALISTAELVVSDTLIENEQSRTLKSINPERLRQMFKQSQILAIEGMYEARALEALRRPEDYNEYRYSDDDDIVLKNDTIKDHAQIHQSNDARQSALFSNFRPPTMAALPNLGTNPFSNNLFKTSPQLPKLPTFALPTPSQLTPPKPPKTSILGNNGGYTTLTNDNVVVVNVLSNN